MYVAGNSCMRSSLSIRQWRGHDVQVRARPISGRAARSYEGAASGPLPGAGTGPGGWLVFQWGAWERAGWDKRPSCGRVKWFMTGR